MKHIAIIIAALVMSATAASAQNEENLDSLNTKSGLSFSDGRLHFDFDVPFYDTIANKEEDKAFDPELLGLGAIWSSSADPFNFNMNRSLEIFWYKTAHVKLGNHFQFDPGCGFGWKNLTMPGNQAMSKTSDEQIVVGDYPVGSDPKLSRLRVFSFGAPLLMSCEIGKGYGFSFGPVVNINAGSCINTKYSIDGDKQKDKYKHVHCNIATVDLMFELNLKHFGFWVKYSPMNLMDKSYWPENQTISFGVAL